MNPNSSLVLNSTTHPIQHSALQRAGHPLDDCSSYFVVVVVVAGDVVVAAGVLMVVAVGGGDGELKLFHCCLYDGQHRYCFG